MRTVTAADANRHFSNMLREVSKGEIITVLSRGRPVATISPVKTGSAVRLSARAALVERLKGRKATGRRTWKRDDLYD